VLPADHGPGAGDHGRGCKENGVGVADLGLQGFVYVFDVGKSFADSKLVSLWSQPARIRKLSVNSPSKPADRHNSKVLALQVFGQEFLSSHWILRK
jgi:hypothetical protein